MFSRRRGYMPRIQSARQFEDEVVADDTTCCNMFSRHREIGYLLLILLGITILFERSWITFSTSFAGLSISSSTRTDAALPSSISSISFPSIVAPPLDPPGAYQLYAWGLGGGRDGIKPPIGMIEVPTLSLNGAKVMSAAASGHSLALLTDGTLLSFGRNDSSGGGGGGSEPVPDAGQLGRGGVGNEPGPVTGGALAGKRVVSVCAGRYHSAAVTEDGLLITWGLSDYGQLGRIAKDKKGNEAPCVSGATCRDGSPGRVSLVEPVASVACGRYHTMAITRAGRVYTMGRDGCSGGLGDLSQKSPAIDPDLFVLPRLVADLAGARIVKISTGYSYWLALDATGGVWSCSTGDDGYAGALKDFKPNAGGELGRSDDPLRPRKLPIMEPVVDVAAGRAAAYAVLKTGKVLSWGGTSSTLGRPFIPTSPIAEVNGLTGIRRVAAGEYYGLAASDTKVFSVGSQGYRTLGIKGRTTDSDVFVEVDLKDARIAGIVGGYQHAFAIACKTADCGTPGSSLGVQKSTEAVSTTSSLPVVPSPPPPSKASSSLAVSTNQTSTSLPSLFSTSIPSVSYPSKPLAYLSQVMAPRDTPASIWKSFYAQNRQSPRQQEIISTAGEDIWQVLDHVELDPTYQNNPCWHAADGRFRCLPGYQILGVSKCGTTDIYARLNEHPDFFESKNKGPHWWDECIYPPREECTVGGNGRFDLYIDLYSDAAAQMKGIPTSMTGEGSSNTFTAEDVWIRGHGRRGNVTIAALLRYAQPYLRNIIIFRNPVDRYASAYRYYNNLFSANKPMDADALHSQVVKDLEAWNACLTRAATAPPDSGMPARSVEEYCMRRFEPQQLVKGMYSMFIQGWLDNWPRDQLLFLRNEDYAAFPREHMEAIFRFLGARPLNETQWTTVVGKEVTNKSKVSNSVRNDTRALLTEFYRPFNERLAAVMQDDRWLWKDDM